MPILGARSSNPSRWRMVVGFMVQGSAAYAAHLGGSDLRGSRMMGSHFKIPQGSVVKFPRFVVYKGENQAQEVLPWGV